MTPPVKVGVAPPSAMSDQDGLASTLAAMAEAGLDHAVVGDHVSFLGGFGMDGLVQATALSMLHPVLPVHTCVYLLGLRHPVLAARQISTLASLAPGRLVLGVGLGGEDRHEVEVCGVDPLSRGRRMDECLALLRPLLEGKGVTHAGEFFRLEDAKVLPAVPLPVPVLVGGRSSAAVRRSGRYGDGWLGIWVSPQRFAAAAAEAGEAAAGAGRDPGALGHALTVWCGFGDDPDEGRAAVAPVMQSLYGLPFARFERYVPVGPAEAVADALRPYIEAGCQSFSLLAQGSSSEAVVGAAAQVRRMLN